ncbi:MAG: prenyltransferase/squalene oxidase repeat-containing protein [Pirellulales bacterium]
MLDIDFDRLLAAYENARHDLLAERVAEGHWVGELASSALATATAVSALALAQGSQGSGFPPRRAGTVQGSAKPQTPDLRPLIDRGIEFLATQQNSDGGFGDTDLSHSNIATTMLVRAAFHLAAAAGEPHRDLLNSAAAYIDAKGSISGLRARYGKDKTFAVPILTNCALAGVVDWREVSALPFELAAFPQSWYRFFRLPVVSYAIPALVAIGQARFFHRKPRNPVVRALRGATVNRTLRVLERMQPESGGYLEAIPLTSFVVMSLAGAGRADHPVVDRGVKFLLDTVRPDGSWPIDTNLATWVTTLAVNALEGSGFRVQGPAGVQSAECGVRSAGDVGANVIEWLLSCQHIERHPFTGAAPGGWGWSDLSGAVPDVDDTASALLALATFADPKQFNRQAPHGPGAYGRAYVAAIRGTCWLANLQNRDGGWPTFCRGWGTLPFDRSSPDLTAHAMRALSAWFELGRWGAKGRNRFCARIDRGFSYLANSQRADGSWSPLWFGNQDHPNEENLVYGTARVLLAYRDLGRMDDGAAIRGMKWLVTNQNADGGWGTAAVKAVSDTRQSVLNRTAANGSSVEETAWALEGLLAGLDNGPLAVDNSLQNAIRQGVDWLVRAVEDGRHGRPAPVGFYFAKLWYYERLYPRVCTVAALGEAVGRLCGAVELVSIEEQAGNAER